MIVIVCDTYMDAVGVFQFFVSFLGSTEPYAIRCVDRHTNSVRLDDDLCYIFVDYRYSKVFESMKADIISVDEFILSLEEYYGEDEFEIICNYYL